jgi:hypothetical protein
MSRGRRRCRSGSSNRGADTFIKLEGHEPHVMARVVASLLSVVVPRLNLKDVSETAPLYALLAVAAGTRQTPALSRAAFGVTENNWLNRCRFASAGTNNAGKDGDEADGTAYRDRFYTGVARVAARLLKLAPRAVPEIVLYPCPGARTADIARVAAATQPSTVRRLALRDFESDAEQAEALTIWEIACAAWGASSLRDLVIGSRRTNTQFPFELCVAAAQCPHLEGLRIPRIFLPPSFVVSTVECPSITSGRNLDAGCDRSCPPLRTTCRFDFAPYTATLRSLELSLGPDDAMEFAFIATQLPSLRCLVLAAYGGSTGRIPSAVWRRGLRQLLRQLHKLYIWSLSRSIACALNRLHTLAAVDAQRSTALGLPPGAMSTILQSDPGEPDEYSEDSDDDTPFLSTPIDADSPISADANAVEDIPLQVFSIFAFSSGRPYSIAPFMRYLGRHAPCLTDVALTRSTADTAAELITMRGSCRALDLRDVHGLTDTIIASILKRHRATLRQLAVDNIVDHPHEVKHDPRAYMDVLGDRDTPQGEPFTKLARVAFDDFGWSDEQRAYFSYLLPGLCDPRAPGLYLMPH